jgi:uncharacterized membrane protein
MDVEVNNDSMIPNSVESILTHVFRDTKISFIFLLIGVITVYVVIFLIVGSNSNSNIAGVSSGSSSLIVIGLELVLWIFLIVIIYINIKHYDDRDIDFKTKIENLFNTKIAELSVDVNKDADISNNDMNDKNETNGTNSLTCDDTDDDTKKEVFHIANNVFTYEEAQNVCKKYNARLATYDEIENAYNKGANWCSYGWSDDQMAFFPTQKKLFNELKKIPGHQNDCGRPGINGGYISNADIKYGANCYGVRPNAKETDKDYMHAINHSPALTASEISDAQASSDNEFNEYVVAPFNKDKWSIIGEMS